ncbi:hypothetical protein ACET3Z_019133 [Daucus carota]
MANSSGFLLIILCALLVSTTVSSTASGYDWMDLKQGCKGSIAECMGVGEEFEMDSESNRRILATSNYISYAALQKNNVPCSKRGASYYNCKQGEEFEVVSESNKRRSPYSCRNYISSAEE